MAFNFINIKIPSSGFSQRLSQQIDQAAQQAISATAITLRDNWQQIGQTVLTDARSDYIQAIKMDQPDKFTADIYMEGAFPKMLEDGFPSFDLKVGFSQSEHVKYSKKGNWYLAIPFRHMTPSRSGAKPKWNTMPKDIYKSILKHSPLTGTEKKYPAGISWTGYKHKTGPYEGMIRNQQTHLTSSGGSTYFTFRTVGQNSDPSSWWHPGYSGVHAMNQIVSQAGRLFEDSFNSYLNQAMNGGNQS